MAEYVGRDVDLFVEGSNRMCFRTLTPTANMEPLDITDGCSNGFRELSRQTGTKSLDLAVEGIAKSAYLQNLAFGGDSFYLENVTLQFPPTEGGSEGASITGNFVMTDYSIGVTYNESTTFTATLQSSGPWIYTEEL